MSEMQQLIQALQSQTQQLLQQQQESHEQRIQVMQQALTAQHQHFTQALGKLSSSGEQRLGSLVDVRGVGQPEKLTDKVAEKDFRVWKLKYVNWVQTAFKSAEKLLTDVLDDETSVVDAARFQSLTSKHPDAERISAHLNATLLSVCEGKAFAVVEKSFKGPSAGLDAFRRLCHRFDPQSEETDLSLLTQIVNLGPFSSTNPTEILAELERREEMMTKHETRTLDTLSDGFKRVMLLKMLVDPLKTHMQLNLKSFDTYEKARAEVVHFLELQAQTQLASQSSQSLSSSSTGPVPMDIGSLAQLGVKSVEELSSLLASFSKGKGKGAPNPHGKTPSGKGKSQKFPGNCNFCHRQGHKEADCWDKYPDKAPKSKGKSKSKSKSAKGKDKSLNTLDESPQQQEPVEAGGFEVDLAHVDGDHQFVASQSWHTVQQGWSRVELTVDSGAGSTAIPPCIAPKEPVQVSETSKLGRQFKTATGHTVSDQGCKKLRAFTDSGVAVSFSSAVADIHKPLLAVSDVCSKGGICHFEEGNSYIQPKGCWKIWMEETKGLYKVGVWLSPSSGGVASVVPLAPFSEGGVLGHDTVSPQDDEHGDSEHAEAQAATTPKSPVLPSDSEVREHCLTHLPFRPWCRHCIRGKAPALAHKEPSNTEYTKPLVAIDYCFLSSSEGNASESPVMVVKSKPDLAVFARLVPSKGCVHEYSVQALADIFRVLGYREFTLKTDGEPSLVALARAAVALLPVEVKVTFEHSPVEESEANGFVERACRSVQEQARTLLSMLHERLQCEFPANHAIFPWLVRHASWLLHHFHRTASGRRAAIRMSDALKFGFTPLCDGCDKLRRGLYGKHSEVEKYDEEQKAVKRARLEQQPGDVAVAAESSAAVDSAQEARSPSSKRPAEQPPEAMDERRTAEPESLGPEAQTAMTDSFESMLQEAILSHRSEVFSMDAAVQEPICDEPSLCEQSHSKDCWDEYFDDVSGLGLNSRLVEIAKKEELRIADEMGLWTPVLRSELPSGTKVIPTRWVLVNKGDSKSPSYRARTVAKEVKGHKPSEVGFYASTPPTESLRALIAVASTNPEYVMDFVDISRAHWCADATRYVVVELPPEMEMPEHVAVLKKSMYGTRDAAHNWEQQYTKVLLSLGFLQGRASSCLFYHPHKDIRLEVHGDDFVSVARALDIKWLHERFREMWKCKFCATLSSPGQSVRILGRLLSRENSGYSLEADPRHAEILISSLGLKNAKGLSTPGVKLQPEEEAELTQKRLSPADTTLFRLGRYLISHRRMLLWFEWQDMPRDLVAEVDADFAGCGKTRKSTSGGAVFFGSSPLRSYSSNQAVIALSTGESEFYGMLKGCSQAMGLRSLFADIGVEVGIRLCTDSSAGKALAEKKGLGRAKHLETQYLWLQDRVANKDVKVFKICTDVNRADMFTKHLHEARASALLSAMNCRFSTGNHSLALAVT
ncbi:unnamed protein product [Symbiodinium natans]|uniref:Reverse transcriptase Ty1/copia-type domain-containing protein n=1 Tax=Symbiodinium natans TaxID=878477 RepID=A0A812TCQ8_9DINO|nr:unnamed protein product [Symbiodinium natans]